MYIPHPIPYQGSKRRLAQDIMFYFPDTITTFIEPFSGSAALSLATAYHNRAKHFIFNDVNGPLMCLWNSIINEPDRLAKYYEKLWLAQLGRERRFYDLVRTRFNTTKHPYYFLYLLARCVKASVRYNADGEFNQSPDNRRKGKNPKTMRKDILMASSLLKGKTSLMTEDYRIVLEQATADDLVYLDPPYQGTSLNRDPRYIRGVDFKQFIDQLNNLNTRNISYIVSYDGRTGNKHFGQTLPKTLDLEHIEIQAGRSTQATLLGQKEITYESLYLSPALIKRIGGIDKLHHTVAPQQLSLFGGLK